MKFLQRFIFFIIAAAALGSCIEDGFTTSPNDQPVFSADTLKMGMLLTEEASPTARFTIYNRAGKSISISSIAVEGDDASIFRLNVDGMSGSQFHDVEIRANDSIFVLVQAVLPATGVDMPVDFDANILFRTNGVDRRMVINAQGQDVERLHAARITADTRFTAGKPYQVFDSLVVARGATLTLEPGTRLMFHDKARLVIEGCLVSRGTVDAPVELYGDRTGNVVADISFDIMSRQWDGVEIRSGSTGNVIEHTDIRNSWFGLQIAGDGQSTLDQPDLTMVNSRLHNSGGLVFTAVHSAVLAAGCEFAEGADGLVWLQGGKHRFDQCTLANNYLFAAITGPALGLAHIDADSDDGSGQPYGELYMTNSIIYGLGSDLSHGDLTGTAVKLERCLLKSEGTDDDNFINCLWGEDPLYYTVREDYLFDYRLQPESPARQAADPSLRLALSTTDPCGTPRALALGAYE